LSAGHVLNVDTFLVRRAINGTAVVDRSANAVSRGIGGQDESLNADASGAEGVGAWDANRVGNAANSSAGVGGRIDGAVALVLLAPNSSVGAEAGGNGCVLALRSVDTALGIARTRDAVAEELIVDDRNIAVNAGESVAALGAWANGSGVGINKINPAVGASTLVSD